MDMIFQLSLILSQLTKAETALLDLRKLFDSAKHDGKPVDKETLSKLSDEFYSALPHNNQCIVILATRKLVAVKYDLCQVLYSVFLL